MTQFTIIETDGKYVIEKPLIQMIVEHHHSITPLTEKSIQVTIYSDEEEQLTQNWTTEDHGEVQKKADELEEIVNQGLQKNPYKKFPTLKEIAQEEELLSA